MEPSNAVSALAALAHEHRLAVYRLLVQRGRDGLAAGMIADAIGIPPSSLTFHLKQLHHVGLIVQRRVSRQIFYSADFAAMDGLVAYLTENCCGDGVVCTPACRVETDEDAFVGIKAG